MILRLQKCYSLIDITHPKCYPLENRSNQPYILTIYCLDRSIGEKVTNTNYYYGASKRGYTSPTYKCGGNGKGGLFESAQRLNDKFSASTSGGGNGQLKYPIALINADEMAMAGGLGYISNKSFYLYIDSYTVSMSASYFFNNMARIILKILVLAVIILVEFAIWINATLPWLQSKTSKPTIRKVED